MNKLMMIPSNLKKAWPWLVLIALAYLLAKKIVV